MMVIVKLQGLQLKHAASHQHQDEQTDSAAYHRPRDVEAEAGSWIL